MKEHVFRLKKDDDLKLLIEKYVKENNINAGVIVSCVGCLYEVIIRDASGVRSIKLEKNVEIVSVTGTVSKNGCHIHIAVSDESLKTYGGHLQKGCLVNTTAEIVILEFENKIFKREMDDNTGYKELVIEG